MRLGLVLWCRAGNRLTSRKLVMNILLNVLRVLSLTTRIMLNVKARRNVLVRWLVAWRTARRRAGGAARFNNVLGNRILRFG